MPNRMSSETAKFGTILTYQEVCISGCPFLFEIGGFENSMGNMDVWIWIMRKTFDGRQKCMLAVDSPCVVIVIVQLNRRHGPEGSLGT